jgi:hypothetical protein
MGLHMDKILISSAEVAQTEVATETPLRLESKLPPAVPPWAKWALSPLVLVAVVMPGGDRFTRCNGERTASQPACLHCMAGDIADRKRVADIRSHSGLFFDRTAAAINGDGLECAR